MPTLSPCALILDTAPAGFKVIPLSDPRIIAHILPDQQDHLGYEIDIDDESGVVHITLHNQDAAIRPAFLVPMDPVAEYRLEVTRRFILRLSGTSIPLLPPSLRLRSTQKRQLIHTLHTSDVVGTGGRARDVANIVLKSAQASLPAIEWKDCAARRHAMRLISSSKSYVEGGYLKILQGK